MQQRKSRNPRSTRYSVLMLLLLLAACGGQAEELVVPTATPLPPILTMLVPPAEDEDETDLDALEAEIRQRTGLVIDVQYMTRYAEALRAVCNSSETMTIVWLDAMTTAAALAQNCGQPALQIARTVDVQLINEDGTLAATEETDAAANATEEAEVETVATEDVETVATEEAEVETVATDEIETTPTDEVETVATDDADVPSAEALTGLPGVIVVNSEFGATDLSLIDTRTFCRLNTTDFYSWLLPTLVFKAAGIDLTGETVTVVDYDDNGDLLEAVSAGECAMAGVPQNVVDAGLPANVEIAQTTIPIPFEVLVYPLQTEGGVRQTLSETLLAIASDPGSVEILSPLLNQAVLLPVTTENFIDLQDLIAAAGVDLAEQGQ
jgi:hypothetical protein